MSEIRQLFQDIKSVFLQEGVDVDNDVNTETPEETKEKTTEEVVTETPEATTEKFEDITLVDGSVAQVEPDVSLGAAMVVQIDDELLPAPDGEWELSDGRVVTTESGIIVNIAEAEEEVAEEEVTEDEEMDKESPLSESQQKEAKKIIESIVTEKHFTLQNDINLVLETNVKLASKVANLETAFSQLLDLTNKLIEEPTTESIKKNKSGFQNLKKSKKSDLIDKLKSKNIIN